MLSHINTQQPVHMNISIIQAIYMRYHRNTEDISLALERLSSSSVKIINKWPIHVLISLLSTLWWQSLNRSVPITLYPHLHNADVINHMTFQCKEHFPSFSIIYLLIHFSIHWDGVTDSYFILWVTIHSCPQTGPGFASGSLFRLLPMSFYHDSMLLPSTSFLSSISKKLMCTFPGQFWNQPFLKEGNGI